MRTNSLLLFIITLIFFTSSADIFSQDRDISRKIPSFDDLMQKAVVPKSGITAVPLEGAIDPESYIVGPGDELTIGIWGAMGVTYPLTVTPEGSLIIPTVGVVNVSQKSLAKAKKEISERTKSKYLYTEVSVTLTSPRTFLVHVTGVVGNEGTHKVSSIDRVDKAVILANYTTLSAANTLLINQSKDNQSELNLDLQKLDPNKIEEIYKRISTRKITLIRNDGKQYNIDIPRFYATGDNKFNPFLLDGDRIFVPLKNLQVDFISVYGELNKQGAYEFVEGDNLKTAILIASGFTSLANKEKIFLYRFNKFTNKRDVIELKYPDDENLILERGDQIFVPSIESKTNNLVIYLSGEIKNTGPFPIERNYSTLSNVIKMAGGFTSNANLRTAVIVRSSDDIGDFIHEDFELIQNLRSATAKSLDSLYLIRELKLKRRLVNVDFLKLFFENDTTQDMILRNGDIIHVPAISDNLYIFGQIKIPGYLPFQKNFSFDDYINSAGGYSDMADESEVKIIKAKTYQWLKPGETELQPGDAIWVPREPERPFLYYFSIARDGLGIIASLATIYLLINQLK